MRVRSDKAKLWLLVGLCALVGGVWAVGSDPSQAPRAADQQIGQLTLASMRDGGDYYESMATALRQVNDNPSEVRAFRQPLAFDLWSLLPSDNAVWVMACLWFALTGIVAGRASRHWWLGPIVTLYLCQIGRPFASDGSADAFLLLESWVTLFVMLALLAIRRGRMIGAVAVASAAVAWRELTGALAATTTAAWLWWERPWRRPRQPVWIYAALVVVWMVVGWGLLRHADAAQDFLASDGRQAVLWGSGGLGSVVDMASYGVGPVFGVAAWLVAIGGRIWRWRVDVASRLETAAMSGLLAFPLLGLAVARPYWGMFLVPLFLLYAVETLVQVRAVIRQAH